MRRAFASVLVLLPLGLALGCEGGDDTVGLMDGGPAWPPPATTDGGPADPELVLAPGPAFAGTLAIEPSAGWTSPPECAAPTDGAYCADCWGWTDEGPWSLDRNEGGDYFGWSIAVADFNKDGYPDLAAAAPFESSLTDNDGSVYVYLGGVRGFQPWLALRVTDFGISAYSALVGGALAAGDFDGDGYADLGVAFWSVYASEECRIGVVYGGEDGFRDGATFTLQDIDPDQSTALLLLGEALVAGDLDGDGYDDLAVGTPEYLVDSLADAGAVFVLEGASTGLAPASRIDLWDASITPYADDRFGGSLAVFPSTSGADALVVGMPGYGWVLTFVDGSHTGGPWSYATLPNFGTRVAAADLDDDGYVDIVASGSSGEEMRVINTGGNTTANIGTFHAGGSTELHPVAVADLDLDGNDDLIAFSRQTPTAEAVILLYQGNGTNEPDDWVVLDDAYRETDDWLGSSVVAADVDGDGLTDVVAGAPTSGSGVGRVHVFQVDDVGDWSLSPAAVQMVDQELELACDICAVHGWSDGTACDDGTGNEICVSQACVTRGCGDGYRQDGALWSPREGCDDGNVANGDACSSACVPTRLPVSSRAGAEDSAAPQARAVAEDGTGNLLFVYTADLGETRELRARRFNYGGAPDAKGSPAIVLASDLGVGWDAQPSVAGLADGGWIVTWTDPVIDADGAGIALCPVDAAGLAGSVEVVNTEARGSQHGARVASRANSWAVAWVDEGGFDGPLGSSIIRGTAFDSTGAVIAGDLEISDPAATASQPAVVQSPTSTLFVWTEDASDSAELSYVMGQRLAGGVVETFTVAGPYASQPTAVVMPDGSYLVAWVRRDPSSDWRGDIQARPVAATGDPLSGSTIVTVVDEAAHSEVAPTLAPLVGSEYLVAYEDGGPRRGLAFAHVGMATLASEAPTLAGYLTDGLQGDVTLLRTSRGIWFAWSDASDFDSVGDPEAYRSFFAYLLPPN